MAPAPEHEGRRVLKRPFDGKDYIKRPTSDEERRKRNLDACASLRYVLKPLKCYRPSTSRVEQSFSLIKERLPEQRLNASAESEQRISGEEQPPVACILDEAFAKQQKRRHLRQRDAPAASSSAIVDVAADACEAAAPNACPSEAGHDDKVGESGDEVGESGEEVVESDDEAAPEGGDDGNDAQSASHSSTASLIKDLMQARLAKDTALRDEDFIAAQQHQDRIGSLSSSLDKLGTCRICRIDLPSKRARKLLIETYYGKCCGHCGRRPSKADTGSAANAQMVGSLTSRAMAEVAEAFARRGGAGTQKECSSLSKYLKSKDKCGQGKGIRNKKHLMVHKVALIGQMFRTLRRLEVDTSLHQHAGMMRLTLRLHGGL